MSIKIGDTTIETDEEGYLVDPNDWNEEVATALAVEEDVELTETHLGLVEFFREYYAENKAHPTMHQVIMTLGKQHGEHFSDQKEYEKYLYKLFPKGPIQQLCRLAGLPRPTEILAG